MASGRCGILLSKIPILGFAVFGLVFVLALSSYVTSQFTQISAMEEAATLEQSESIVTRKVSTGVRVKIDNWLTANNLNQYGDLAGTIYAGGSPLMDMTSGKNVDRYEYLMQKFPDKPWDKT